MFCNDANLYGFFILSSIKGNFTSRFNPIGKGESYLGSSNPHLIWSSEKREVAELLLGHVVVTIVGEQHSLLALINSNSSPTVVQIAGCHVLFYDKNRLPQNYLC